MSLIEEDYEISEYERRRNERIKRNQEYLASLGLDKTKQQRNWEMIRMRQPKRVYRPTVAAGEERRSKRIKARTALFPGDKDEDEGLLMISYDEAEDRQLRAVKQSDNAQTVDLVKSKETIRVVSPSRPTLTGTPTLSEGQRKILSKSDMDQNYLDKFREFLVYHDKISSQNERNVMRQVTKLATGEGVRYESARYGWPEGCYFMKGIKITPLSDLVDLLKQAIEAENKWGIDRGNGWLLRHPIKKLMLFQQFCLNKPDFLTSECKLEDFYQTSY